MQHVAEPFLRAPAAPPRALVRSKKKQKEGWAADEGPLPGLDPLLSGGAGAIPMPKGPIREMNYGGEGDAGNRAERRAAEKERKRRAKDAEDEDEAPSKGVSWTGIFLMAVMFGPAVFPVLMMVNDYLAGTPIGDAMTLVLAPVGEIMGGGLVAFGLSQSYQQQVEAFYMEHSPDKIGRITGLLKKFEGKEEELLMRLERKYALKAKREAARKKRAEKAARKKKLAEDYDLEEEEEDD